MNTTAQNKLKQLWQPGDLFHNVSRYPRKGGARPVDRLAGILQHGLLAPATCADGSVYSDLNLTVTGSAVPYDSLVFLHRFGPQSFLYTFSEPGQFTVFVDPATPVLTPAEMGPHWALLCRDEVYVRERVPVEQLIGIAIHPADAEAVRAEFLPVFERLALPLYLHNGTAIWPGA